MKKPSLKLIIFALLKAISISLITQLFLSGMYYAYFKMAPFGLDALVIRTVGFGSGFIYYFWVEQKKLFQKKWSE